MRQQEKRNNAAQIGRRRIKNRPPHGLLSPVPPIGYLACTGKYFGRLSAEYRDNAKRWNRTIWAYRLTKKSVQSHRSAPHLETGDTNITCPHCAGTFENMGRTEHHILQLIQLRQGENWPRKMKRYRPAKSAAEKHPTAIPPKPPPVSVAIILFNQITNNS